MMTVPGIISGAIYLIVLMPSAKSTLIISPIFLISYILNWFFFFLFSFAQLVSPIGYLLSCADLSLFLNVIGRIFFIEFSSVKTAILALNFFYLKFNIIFANLRSTFINNISIEIFFYIPVIARASLLIMFWIFFHGFLTILLYLYAV